MQASPAATPENLINWEIEKREKTWFVSVHAKVFLASLSKDTDLVFANDDFFNKIAVSKLDKLRVIESGCDLSA